MVEKFKSYVLQVNENETTVRKEWYHVRVIILKNSAFYVWKNSDV